MKVNLWTSYRFIEQLSLSLKLNYDLKTRMKGSDNEMTKRMSPRTPPAKARSRLVSRMNEIFVDAGVSSNEFGNCRARTAKEMPTNAWPSSFGTGRRPSDRCFLILMKSSRKPTTPRPAASQRTRRPEAVGTEPVSRCPRR